MLSLDAAKLAMHLNAVIAHASGALAELVGGQGGEAGSSLRRATITVPTEGTQPERVLAYLRQSPNMTATRRQLVAAFDDMNDNSLSGAITRLKDRGQIELLGRGRYRATLQAP